LYAAADASGNAYYLPACSSLDAGQINIMIDRPIVDFQDTECPCLSKKLKNDIIHDWFVLLASMQECSFVW